MVRDDGWEAVALTICGLPRRKPSGGRNRPSITMSILFSNLVSDVRFALRGFRRSPLFAIVAILSLALGIGANTAIFTLIDQILLRKLPVTRPDELVMLYQTGRAQRQQHGRADALVSDLPGLPAEGRAARRGAVPAAGAGLGQRRQPDRAARRRSWSRATTSRCSG